MWWCIYSANYATRAAGLGPRCCGTHHVEIRDAYVHVSPPLAQELAPGNSTKIDSSSEARLPAGAGAGAAERRRG